MKAVFTCLITLCILILASSEDYSNKNLNSDWQFKVISCPTSKGQQISGKTFNTSVPNNIYLDLLNQNIIQDPFIQMNHPKVKWVSQCQITYIKKINIEQKDLEFQNIKLIFQGIDTYSDILINGEKIQTTKNAFIQYRVSIKDKLKIGENIIQVNIFSPTKYDEEGQTKNRMPYKYAQTRKACYQYGWDWAPDLISLGIWKSVYLQSFNKGKIDYVWVRNRMISNQKAILNFAISLQGNKWVSSSSHKQNIQIKQGQNLLKVSKITDKHLYVDVQIINPKLWWPNNIGTPNVYEFNINLVNEKKQIVHSKSVIYGIRDIHLNLKQKKFEVKINGYPIYCKGANYVPPDMFYPRLTNNRYKPANTLANLVNDMVDSHFNMIRLWGGGQYQSNQFLQLCSRKGIMIFYDFMFSDSIYPSTQEFLQNVQQEIKQQIRRARNYPALALWSGNNQILQGIQDWGWGSQKFKDDYNKLFEKLIPSIIEYQSPYISYIPSSPVYGVGNYGFERGGDIHFWGVWAGSSLFEAYEGAIGSFNSQFGTQGLPVWETIVKFATQNQRSYTSEIFSSHQKHNSRFGTLNMYVNNYGKKALNFELQAYQSGLVQAYGVSVAIIGQRCSKPKSMGTLYWQLNDAWPGISWSSIDYFGRWKPLQYMAKRLYPDVGIFFFKNHIYTVNDKLFNVQAIGFLKLIDFDGNIILNKTFEQLSLKANQVKQLMIFDQSNIQGKQNKVVLKLSIIAGKNDVMESTHFFKKMGQLELPSAKLQVEYDEQFNCIWVSSDKVIKSLFIYNTKEYVKLSDNYFDLIPGERVKVFLKDENKKLSQLKDTMKYRSYKQVYTNEELNVTIKK